MLLWRAVPPGRDKSFNVRTFLRCLGLLHFMESLWLPHPKSPLCILQFHPFKTGFGHQMTSNTHQDVLLAQLFSQAVPAQRKAAAPGPSQLGSTLCWLFSGFPHKPPPTFSRSDKNHHRLCWRRVSLCIGCSKQEEAEDGS